VAFFLGFTYIELIDKTNYLNHYYFITLVSFLMALLPAGRYFSVDAWRRPAIRRTTCPAGWWVRCNCNWHGVFLRRRSQA
jgi:hypothetical protein